jgi:hypothetical protein
MHAILILSRSFVLEMVSCQRSRTIGEEVERATTGGEEQERNFKG